MRATAEHLAQAVEFDRLASSTPDPELKMRYAELAEAYRLLATEREKLMAMGALPSEAQENLDSVKAP